MLLREKDGKFIKHEIAYYNGGLSHDLKDVAVEIHPNEEYWEEVFGIRPMFDLDPNGWDADIVDFVEKYWVRKDLFQRVVTKCEELDIPVSHAHDLVIPLSDFPMTEVNMLGKDIQTVAKESVALRKMFADLIENPLLTITAITFEMGYGPLGNGRGGIHFLNNYKVPIKSYRALMPLVAEFKRLLETDEQFRMSVLKPTVANYDNYSYPKAIRLGKESYLVDVYDYIMHMRLARTKHNGALVAWQFMSLVSSEFTSEEEFIANQKIFEGYGSYKKYAGDLSRKTIKATKKKLENFSVE